MKIVLINWKKEDLGYEDQEHNIKNTVIVHNNGAVLAIDKETSGLILIDVLSKRDINKYFNEDKYDIFNLSEYTFNLIDHSEYYFLEKSWLLKICNFLDKHKMFSLLAFNAMLRFDQNDPKLSRQIAQQVINGELIRRDYVARYGSYCYTTQEGIMFARQTKGVIETEIVQNVQDFITAAPTFLEGHMHEFGRYRDMLIEDIYKDQASKKWMLDATPKNFATEFAKMVFLKIVPTSKIPSIIKLLKINEKTFNDILDKISKDFTHIITTEQEDKKERETIKHTTERMYGKNKVDNTNDTNDDADNDNEEDDDEEDADDDDDADDDTSNTRLDDQDEIATKYLLEMQSAATEVCFDSKDVQLIHNNKKLDKLLTRFNVKDKTLKLKYIENYKQVVALLFATNRLNEDEVRKSIKSYPAYASVLTVSLIRQMAIDIMTDSNTGKLLNESLRVQKDKHKHNNDNEHKHNNDNDNEHNNDNEHKDEHKDEPKDEYKDEHNNEDIPDQKFLYEWYDKNIDIITDPIYIKQTKVSIIRNHFNGTNELFWDKDRIDLLHEWFLAKDKALQLHMQGDTINLLAVLLYHEKLTRKQIYNYIKTRKDYPNQVCLRDIITRFLEMGLMK